MTREIALKIAALTGAAQTIDKLITALQTQLATIHKQITELKARGEL